MKFTYTHYLLNSELEQFKSKIDIVSIEQMSLGAMVKFHCEDSETLTKIFGEE
jgi:hypothetical protein